MDIARSGGLGCVWLPTTVEEAARIAGSRFGLEGEAIRLATEKDDTFRIRTEGGGTWILKVANPEESAAEIDLQLAVLDHIADRDPAFSVPRVRRGRDGAARQTLAAADGARREARMMSYVAGVPLSLAPGGGLQRRRVGAALARVRLALADFSHPHDRRTVAWDVRHLAGLRPLLAHIAGGPDRRLVERALQRFDGIAGALARTRFQVLHNDFTRSNILVDPQDPDTVTGVIDFGDVVRTSVAVDVAVAMQNQLPDEAGPDLFAEARDLLDGYLACADLTPGERSLLPDLVLARTVARLLIATWRAAMMPANAEYVLVNVARSWKHLHWFVEGEGATLSGAGLLPRS